jgi:hypothetical protein
MTISYFLSKLIQRLKKVKFILVFSSGMATSNNPNQKIETLNSFLSLFNFNSMSQVVKEELFKSVSFVVTRAT